MFTYSVIQWLFFFYFYCFFGWCFESTYVSVCQKKWINRGFMKGPFLPLYGSGGIMLLVVSKPFEGNLWMTYLSGVVGATILEYFTGMVMEHLFKVRYWDYSDNFMNLKGRICLKSSLAWGGLTILMTEVVHQGVEFVMYKIPEEVLSAGVMVLTVIIAGDFTLSFKEAMDLRNMLVKLEKLREEAQHLQKRIDVVIAITAEDIANKKEELREELELFIEDAKMDATMRKEHIEQKLRETLLETEQKASVLAEYAKKPLARVLRVNPGMKSHYFKFWEEWKKH